MWIIEAQQIAIRMKKRPSGREMRIAPRHKAICGALSHLTFDLARRAGCGAEDYRDLTWTTGLKLGQSVTLFGSEPRSWGERYCLEAGQMLAEALGQLYRTRVRVSL